MKLADKPLDALRWTAGYLRTARAEYGREVWEDGEKVGYWQTIDWMDGLRELAEEAMRVASLPNDHEAEIADLKRQLAEALAARDNAERMQAIWGGRHEAACLAAAEARRGSTRGDFPPHVATFLDAVGIHSPKGT